MLSYIKFLSLNLLFFFFFIQCCFLETYIFYILGLLPLYKLHNSALNECNIFYLSILLLMISRQFLIFCYYNNAMISIFIMSLCVYV